MSEARDRLEKHVPTYYDLMWPTLQAVIRLGGSGGKDEIEAEVIEREGYTDEQQRVLKGNGPQTLLLDRLSWARSYLKGMGLMTNPRRGVWAVTDMGETAELKDLRPLHVEYLASVKARAALRGKRQVESTAGAESLRVGSLAADPLEPVEQAEWEQGVNWKERLLDRLLKLDPKSFEHLAQRILRESGFSRVNVTGRSNDGGIDGLGVYKISLLSFPVFFQCKRYSGSVSSAAIRDFRGAMAGRGDKGLFITTGAFTSEAQKEAKRDGAQPIDLIDGDALCDLLKDLSLGVSTTERVVEDVVLLPGFFDALDDRHGLGSQ